MVERVFYVFRWEGIVALTGAVITLAGAILFLRRFRLVRRAPEE